MILPITTTMAGAATLINIWLARRVGQVRIARKISIGDGGDDALARRMRAHANFTEYTPFFLILLLLIELAIGSQFWLWIVGALFILARIVHPFGMEARGKPGRLRLVGIGLTALILLGLALYALFLTYSQPMRPRAGDEVRVGGHAGARR